MSSALARASRLLSSSAVAFRHLKAAPSIPVRTLCSYPDDRKYMKSHEWVKMDGNVATVGITDHAQKALGDIVFADLPEVGSDAESGKATAAIESVKAAADIYAPVTGEVVGVNDALGDTPDLINKNPHDDGWMFKVKVADSAEVDAMMSAKEYSETLDKK